MLGRAGLLVIITNCTRNICKHNSIRNYYFGIAINICYRWTHAVCYRVSEYNFILHLCIHLQYLLYNSKDQMLFWYNVIMSGKCPCGEGPVMSLGCCYCDNQYAGTVWGCWHYSLIYNGRGWSYFSSWWQAAAGNISRLEGYRCGLVLSMVGGKSIVYRQVNLFALQYDIYIYMCVCVCVCVYKHYDNKNNNNNTRFYNAFYIVVEMSWIADADK